MVLSKLVHRSGRLQPLIGPQANGLVCMATAARQLPQRCPQSAVVIGALLLTLSSLATQPQKVVQAQSLPSNIETLEPATPQVSAYSIPKGKSLMAAAETAISAQDYSKAATNLVEARQLLLELTELYKQLNDSFRGIDNRTSRQHREKALEAATLRDEATYRLAVVYRAQNRPDQAIPLLIEVVGSQPTRELGKKSYQQLLELGFVDTPFPGPTGAQPTPPSQ
jgi:tetratricopeptide (TPR) repeat protein